MRCLWIMFVTAVCFLFLHDKMQLFAIFCALITNTSEYMNDHIFELRRKRCRQDWSSLESVLSWCFPSHLTLATTNFIVNFFVFFLFAPCLKTTIIISRGHVSACNVRYSAGARECPSVGLGWSSIYTPGSDTCWTRGDLGWPMSSLMALFAGSARLIRHIRTPITTNKTKTMHDKGVTATRKICCTSGKINQKSKMITNWYVIQ